MIAGHAKSLGYTVVTNNTKEFEKVKGLKLEDWADDGNPPQWRMDTHIGTPIT